MDVMQHGRFGHRPVRLVLPRRYFDVDPAVLTTYLPLFMAAPIDPMRDLVHLSKRRHGMNEKAFTYIFLYLEEISRLNISDTLNQSLEKFWKRYRQHDKGYGGWGYKRIGQLFYALCDTLSRDMFGCNAEIAGIMSNFFARHCDELMRHDPMAALGMALALQDLPLPATNALACILQHKDGAYRIFRDLETLQRRGEGGLVTPEALATIEALLSLDDHRLKSGSLVPVRQQSSSVKLYDQLGRAQKYIKGSRMTTRQLQQLCLAAPERLLVKRGSSRHEWDEENEFLDLDDELSSDDEGDHHFGRRRRRGYGRALPFDEGFGDPRRLGVYPMGGPMDQRRRALM